MISVREIKQLYDLFEDSDIGELEIHNENTKIRLEFGERKRPAPAPVSAPAAIEKDKTEGQAKNDSSLPPNMFELKSKWVGFFTRLNPKSGEYYVKLRDEVKVGQVIAHVRVLGVLQDVKAEQAGKVKELLVEEGQPIEYGQPILRFEK